jgi:hypothetical protein
MKMLFYVNYYQLWTETLKRVRKHNITFMEGGLRW